MSRRVLAVTHVFPRFEGDPSAPFLLTWARALTAAGASVGVIAPHDAGFPVRHVVGGVPVRRVRYAPEVAEVLAYRGEMHQLARSPWGAARIAALLETSAVAVRMQARAGDVDVVHAHWWLPSLIAVRLARPPAGVVVTVHGTDVALLEQRPWLAPLARWALACADRIEAVSTDLAERLERSTGRAADAVNPMPLQERWFDSPALRVLGRGGPPLVLAVGRLVTDKGFADLIEAAALLDQPVRVRIVGDGPQREALAEQAAGLGVELELPGRIGTTQLRTAYAEADVVVQPSHREGFGLVAAEALLAGVPVVATDSGGVRDVLGLPGPAVAGTPPSHRPEEGVQADTAGPAHGQAGPPGAGLVPVGDVRGLAAAIAAALREPDLEQVRAAAERLRGLLSPDAAAARTLAGYEALRGGSAG